MLTERMANQAAMQTYLEDLGGDNRAWRTAFREAFFRAMRDTLTERQYEALRLHYLEGKSQKEIAALWGVSPSAVCRHLARGKKRLRHLLSYNLEFRV
ncbi:MAG: RNA polymerase sigma factor [Butyricicoccus sp.]